VQEVYYYYYYPLFHNLCKRRYHLHALFLIDVHLGFKFSPSCSQTVGLRLPTRYLRHLSMFNVDQIRVAANVVYRNDDSFPLLQAYFITLAVLLNFLCIYNNCIEYNVYILFSRS
jgi:hypothetical protein